MNTPKMNNANGLAVPARVVESSSDQSFIGYAYERSQILAHEEMERWRPQVTAEAEKVVEAVEPAPVNISAERISTADMLAMRAWAIENDPELSFIGQGLARGQIRAQEEMERWRPQSTTAAEKPAAAGESTKKE